jgi:two-component system NtrC family sensor kinase
LGYEYAELIGANCRDFYTEEFKIKARELFEKLKHGHKVEDEEMAFIRKDNEIVYGLLSISAVKDDKGKIIATRGIVKDITERRKLTQQLMMQDRLVSIGELVSGVAHEINNPLTGIIGFSEMLLKRDFPEEAIEDIQAILDESKRIAGIVRNLLTFARKQPQEKAAVNINEIVQKCWLYVPMSREPIKLK